MFSREKRETNADASIPFIVTVIASRADNLLCKALTDNKTTKIVNESIRKKSVK